MKHALAMAALLLSGCAGAAAPARAQPIVAAEQLELDGVGYCVGGAGPIDLRDVLFLQNRAVDRGERRISIEYDQVLIATHAGEQRRTYYFDLNTMIDETEPPDIDLTLVLVDGELAVYWRETFQHRMYRQGIYAINDLRLEALCDGVGGMTRG